MHGCLLPFKFCFKPRGEGSGYVLESFDKLLIKSTQPDKLSNLMDRGWRRPTSNNFDLFRVHVYCIFIDDVSAKRNSRLEEN